MDNGRLPLLLIIFNSQLSILNCPFSIIRGIRHGSVAFRR